MEGRRGEFSSEQSIAEACNLHDDIVSSRACVGFFSLCGGSAWPLDALAGKKRGQSTHCLRRVSAGVPANSVVVVYELPHEASDF